MPPQQTLHLVLRLRMSATIPLLALHSFLAFTGNPFHTAILKHIFHIPTFGKSDHGIQVVHWQGYYHLHSMPILY